MAENTVPNKRHADMEIMVADNGYIIRTFSMHSYRMHERVAVTDTQLLAEVKLLAERLRSDRDSFKVTTPVISMHGSAGGGGVINANSAILRNAAEPMPSEDGP